MAQLFSVAVKRLRDRFDSENNVVWLKVRNFLGECKLAYIKRPPRPLE